MLTLLLAAACSAAACGLGPECVHGDCIYGDGAYFCQCRRGWAGAACDAPRAGFLKIPASGRAASDRAVNYACLVNGTECTDSKKCSYYAGAYSCDPCPADFVSYEGECLPKSCFNNDDYNNQEASAPPCNGRGRCLLKDPGMAGLNASDYACDCYPIYRGALCHSCDDANAIAVGNTPSSTLPTCNARACQDADGVVCSGHGKCVLDVGLDRESYHYRCNCNTGYTRVGHKCVKAECVATVDGSPVVCGGFGECTEEGEGAPKCTCDSNAVQVGKFCTYPSCTTDQPSEICGGVGACVRDGAAYSCDCRGLATGKLCETCINDKSAQVDGKCVPLGCLAKGSQASCVGGTCVKSDGAYHCRCPDMLVAVDGKCTSPACTDEELGLVCSGHGTCKIDDPAAIVCTCDVDYTYVAPGRCILSSLIDSSNKICSGNGRIVISADTPPTMTCQCSSLYTGSTCAECNQQSAQTIDGKCVANKCIVQQPQPNAYTATAQDICGGTGDYTTFGNPNDPFITCTPKTSDTGTVSAYNGTFFGKAGCVHVSKIDKTRRFYCGFLKGLTDDLQEDQITCSVSQEGSISVETCNKCPDGFKLVHFGQKEGYKKTCMHDNCYHGTSSRMWYDYCGGVGDCIKKDGQNYACDCGAGATWDNTLKACITDACKLNKTLAGPYAPDYCVDQRVFEDVQCVVGRDNTWQCSCEGATYTTYNKTCILKSKNADPTTKLARGFCGGPGAGYLDSSGACVCNSGFRKIGDMCYSYDCLPVGVTADTRGLELNPHVCSGKGVCVYNQLTGRYGCECNNGYEAFGGYCTQPGCAGKVIYNGEVKYVECKVYDGSVGKCATISNGKYSCNCAFPYHSVNGLCVHRGCLLNDKYCGGDVLASCAKGSDSRYGCVCSEGYELSDERNEYGNKAKCVPSKCMYKQSTTNVAVECNGLGTCSNTGLLKDKECTCTTGAKEYTLRDATGELKKTCVLDICISSGADTNTPVICGGFGRCGPNGCVCDLGTKLVDKSCIGLNCFINMKDDNGRITESVCGGEAVGVCTKVASFGDRQDYACKCKDPSVAGYKEVDGFCLPKSCIFEITTLDGNKQDTMCGGKQFGTCVLNATQAVTPYCECINRYDIVKVTTGKCMKRDCLSDSLPGGPTGYVECSGHGTCRGDHNAGYSCSCAENYQTVRDNYRRYLCIPQACVVSSTDTTTICSGRGTCQFGTETDSGQCNCGSGYTGDKCQNCLDGYKEHTDKRCYLNNCPADSCSADASTDAGTCQFGGNSFSCACINSSFVVDSGSKKCRKSRCVWKDPYDSLEKTCYGMGTCNDNGESTGQCSCNSNTVPVGTNICVYNECVSGDTNAQTICKERGVCIESIVAGKGMCRCDSNIYRTDKKSGQCFVKECFGANESILSEVCDGGGTCDENAKRCNCDSNNGFQNLPNQNGCVHTNCISSNNKLCSGFGACEKTDGSYRCMCANHYTLVEKDCVPTNCLNGTVTCNGGGTCTGVGASAACSCKQGWALRGTLCYPAACVANGLICGGNGDCPLSDGGSCNCRSGYESTSDELCISSRCVQRGADGTVQVCGGNGSCVSESGVEPSCVCNEGFSLTGDFVCGVPASSNKSSAGITAAIVVVVLLVLAAVAGFLVWRFVIRPRKAGVLRERAPRKDASLTRSRSLKKQAASGTSFHADAPLLSQLSNANSSIQL